VLAVAMACWLAEEVARAAVRNAESCVERVLYA
jgi:hypothetical protein